MLPRPAMLTKKNPVLFNLLLAATFAVGLTACKPPGPKALLDGQRLLEKGRVPEAVERLEVASELLRTNAHAWNYLGVAYHQAGQGSNAVVAYKRALTVNPDLMEARLNLGMLNLETGRAAEAKSDFTAYTLSRPNESEGYLRLATAELRLRELAQAELHIRKALQLEETSAEGWNTLGMIQLQRNRPHDAVQSFATALKKRSDFAPALLNLAIVHHQHLGDRVTALRLYRGYLQLKPRPANADSVTATARQLEIELAPRPAAAVTPPPEPPVATQAVAAKPTMPTNPPVAKPVPAPVIARAEAPKTETPKPKPTEPKPNEPKLVEPKPSEVVASTSRPAPTVVELPPEPVIRTAPVETQPVAVAQARAAPEETTLGTNADAAPEKRSFFQAANPANLFRRSKTVTPLPPSKSDETAEAKEPDPSTAVEPASPSSATSAGGTFARYKYQGAGRTTPGDRMAAQRFAAKGSEALQTKRYLEAANAFRSAVDADPSWFDAHLNLAAAALQGGRVVEALHAGETALALNPDSVQARYNFALALKRGNYILDAVVELERLLAANPGEADAHLVLGNIYAEQLRQAERARTHYLKVLELTPQHPRATAIRFWLKANPR